MICPALGMNGNHNLGGQFIFLCSFYNVVSSFKNQSFFYPAFLLRNFIANGVPKTIPAAAGIGEIENPVEVNIKIGLADDVMVFVVVGLSEAFSFFEAFEKKKL